jgi:hypothetical protein
MRRDGLGLTLEVENKLHEQSRETCRGLMGVLLNAKDVEVPLDFPQKGEAPAGSRSRDALTLFGRVRVEKRNYYHRADAKKGGKKGRFPFDEALGLVGGCTPACAMRAMEFAAKEPYEKAAESFGKAYAREMTPDILKALARLLAKKTGRFALEANPEPAPGKPAECVAVSMDGASMPMLKKELRGVKGRGENGEAKTREVKIGVVYQTNPAPGDPRSGGKIPDSATCVATLERKDAFADFFRKEFDRRFASLPRTVLFLGDGGKWIWDVWRTRFKFAVPILDFYHAAEHLAPLLELAGMTDKKKRGAQFRKWKRWLKEGKASKLIFVCEEYALKSDPDKAQKWQKALQYYRDNLGRMKYDEYLAKGWPIGSGVVESACKTLIGGRFKQSGMRWTRKGADALLPLRTAIYSGRYDQLWRFIIGDKKMVRAA